MSRCVGEPTNTRNALTVTTVTAALRGLGRRAAQAGRARPGGSGRPSTGGKRNGGGEVSFRG